MLLGAPVPRELALRAVGPQAGGIASLPGSHPLQTSTTRVFTPIVYTLSEVRTTKCECRTSPAVRSNSNSNSNSGPSFDTRTSRGTPTHPHTHTPSHLLPRRVHPCRPRPRLQFAPLPA